MKRIFIYYLLFFISNHTFSQKNYVTNGSFENLSNCPDDGGQLELAIGWFSPNLGTPDLYNKCSPVNGAISAPQNSFSIYREAKTGNGYMGVQVYETPGFKTETREYGAIKLNQSLKFKKNYYFIFYVVTRYWINNISSQCFSDAIGLAVSKDKIQEQVPYKRLPLNPIAFNKGKILDDTTGWTKISNIYKGNGEQYIYIGSFEPNLTTLNTKESCEKNYLGHSYYFIDDVGVYEYDPLPDTLLLCKGQSKRMGGSFLDGTYRWNTGAKDSVITINKSGRYILTTTMDGKHELADTMYVINPEETIALLPRDTSYCKGESLKINFPTLGNYQWNNGTIQNSLNVKEQGIYKATISTTCGTYPYQIEVKEKDCNCNIYIPTAFSPHQQDGFNDELRCYAQCGTNFKVLRFQVFDRWGNQVYLIENEEVTNIFWNGTFRGELLPQGVYTYTLEYEYLKKGNLVKDRKFGEFMLMH
jgi:gliding motility-associated-like protein